MAEHFVRPPEWTWYILGYFFFAGLTGGLYAIGTMLRLWGRPGDEAAARTAFLWAFPILVVCPILLTLDLGSPLRFWHMLVATTPGQGGFIFHYWSPMSAGSWALVVYGVFALVSFLEATGRLRGSALATAGGRLVNVIGALLGLFVASYTGVLLSVSNQPVWSDTWTLGGLFLASGLSGAAAFLAAVARRDAAAPARRRGSTSRTATSR
jgi:formate-dependent nitrite reductase membrane component NrfD